MPSIVEFAPQFDEKEAVKIGRDLFAIESTAKMLPSERDQNFCLTTASGDRYVLKVANSREPICVLDFQNQALMHIQKKCVASKIPIGCPEVLYALDGKQITWAKGVNDQKHAVRLLSYLSGRPFSMVKPRNAVLLESLGRFFGELDRLLNGFDHPAAHREFHWDLKRAADTIDRFQEWIENRGDQELVRRFLKRFQTGITPRLPDLPIGVVHNDGNDHNVLVEPAGRWGHRVTGVIDFGDMIYTCMVSEVAIASAYAMLDQADPLSAAVCVISGYNRVVPLNEDEVHVLFDLICMRLCLSVCHCARQSRAVPENEYLKISNQPVWRLLRLLSDIHPRFARYRFRQACAMPPVPQSKKIVKWLSAHTDDFAPVVDANLNGEKPVVFDLSVGSPLVPAVGADSDMSRLSQDLFEQIRAAGARVGIGKYDEARAIYAADQYRIVTDEMPEQRTIHLGIDLHLPPGSPVYTFWDGEIHSFNNNSDPMDYGPTIIMRYRTHDDTVFYALYGHLSRVSLKGLEKGMQVKQGDAIGSIGDMDVNGGWPPHLHFQIITDRLGGSGNFPGVARPSDREVWRAISPDPNLVLGIQQNCLGTSGRRPQEILTKRKGQFGSNLSIAYDRPIKMVRGRGQYLYDDAGQVYLDGVNNVCHVGHCHPHVVAAGRAQMAVLNTNTRYLHDHIITYAERLLDTFPDPLEVCFFVCTGSEANELALRLATTYTGRRELIVIEGAYHGNTQGLIDISPYKYDGPGGRGRPAWVHAAVMPDGFRGPHKGVAAETGRQYAAYVRETVDEIQRRIAGPAAFISESILGCGGQIVLPEQYLKTAFKYVRDGGGLCIVDEVQVGFGRSGCRFWAFETQGVVPDIVTLGKPMGNGHPLAAVVTTQEIASAFANGMEYFNTFGGNPVSCAIGMAVMDVIEAEGLQENARIVGDALIDGLNELKGKHPLVGDVRGMGLFVGVELVTDRQTLEPASDHAAYIINRMRDYGILISTDGPMANVLKIKPPMVWTPADASRVVEVLDKVLSEDRLQVD